MTEVARCVACGNFTRFCTCKSFAELDHPAARAYQGTILFDELDEAKQIALMDLVATHWRRGVTYRSSSYQDLFNRMFGDHERQTLTRPQVYWSVLKEHHVCCPHPPQWRDRVGGDQAPSGQVLCVACGEYFIEENE